MVNREQGTMARVCALMSLFVGVLCVARRGVAQDAECDLLHAAFGLNLAAPVSEGPPSSPRRYDDLPENDRPGTDDSSGRAGAERAGAVRRPSLLWAGVFSAGAVGYNAVKSFTDEPRGGFRFADEGWFGRSTYAGGADKASHVVAFAITSRELAGVYEHLGFSKQQSVVGGFAVSVLGGLVNELGDGTNRFGFSYEDLVMDVVGAGAAALNNISGTEDLFGIRFGVVPGPKPGRDPDSTGFGKDYSKEIYAVDLQLGGVARRLGTLWPLRLLLLSTTYGVRGYPYGSSRQREQLLGFEVGLNVAEVLYACNVRRDTWWGIAAHVLLDNFRIPYTQVGFRYDLHRGTFHLVNAHGY